MNRHNRSSIWIFGSALALAATGAFAGRVTLCEDHDFHGSCVATGEGIANMTKTGFSDTASSIIVSDGTWEACSGAHFGGRCVQLVPGSYPRFDVDTGGRIASVREVIHAAGAAPTVAVESQPIVISSGRPVVVTVAPPVVTAAPRAVSAAPPVVVAAPPVVSAAPPVVVAAPVAAAAAPPVVTAAPIGHIVLYEFPNFGGSKVAVGQGQAKDLDWANFSNPNHRATSVRVEAGTWIVCTDRGFQGACRVLGPGEYPQLPEELATGVSSAEQLWRPEYGALSAYDVYAGR